MRTEASVSSASPWRVVVIEDSREDREEIRRLLLLGSERRYRFEDAETGAAGLQAVFDASHGAPDCVILDFTLPDIDAMEVLAALVGPDGLSVCPVVVVTGTAELRLGTPVLRAGAQDFIGKSWMTAASLTRAVENAVERWAISHALQVSQQYLKLAVEVAGLGVSRIDYETNAVVLDAVAAGLFGFPAEVPMPRRAIHATFHPDDRDEIFRLMNQSLDPSGDGWFVMEHRVVHPDGSVRWISVKKQVAFGEVAGVRRPRTGVLAATDITERKMAEAELSKRNDQLAETEARIRSVVNNVVYGIITIDERGEVEAFNSAAEQLFGYRSEEVVGRNVKMLMAEPHHGGHDGYLADYKRTNQAKIIGIGREVEGRRKNGTIFPMDLGISEFLRGERRYFTGVVRDITERREAEETIARQVREMDGLYATVPTGLFQFDANLRYVRVNAWTAVINGCSIEAHLGRTVREVLSQEVAEQVEPMIRRILQTGEPVLDLEIHGTTATSLDAHDWLANYYPVRGADGEVVGVHGVVQDVTERRRSEAALRTSETRYRRLFEAAKDGVLLLDAQTGRITDANPYILELLGGARAEVLGRELWEIGVFGDASASLAAMAELQDRGFVRYDDLPLQSKTGLRREVEVVANVYQENGNRVIQCNIRDVTERKLAEERLQASEERFRALAETVPQFVWSSNAEGIMDYVNPQWIEYSGLTLEETVLQTDNGVFHPEDVVAMYALWKAARRNGIPYQSEARIRRAADGVYRWFMIRGTPFRDASGETVRWFGVTTEIEEQKQAQAKIENLNVRLQRSVAESHHRIKNNLQVLSAMIELQSSGEEGRAKEKWMRLNGHIHALATLHDILTTENRDGSSDIDSISGREALLKLLPLLSTAMGGRQIAVDADEGIVLPVKEGSSFFLLVNELVSNAQKHGRGDIAVILRRTDGGVRLEVCDDGPGFPVGFDPVREANTGLELIESLVHWDLRGSVAYENRTEGGARVVVAFPYPESDMNETGAVS